MLGLFNGSTPVDMMHMTAARLAVGLRRLDLVEEGKKDEHNFFWEEHRENLEGKAGEEWLQALDQDTHTNGIHLSDLDFDEITEKGALANAGGALGVEEFETVMRKQIYAFIQRTAYDCLAQTEPENKTAFAERVCFKFLLEQKISVIASAPGAGAGGEGTLNRKQRLRELKEWFEEGLISEDKYLAAQNAIISELHEGL